MSNSKTPPPSPCNPSRRYLLQRSAFIFSAVFVAGLLGACSKQAVYENARQNRLQDCEKYEGSLRERCIADYQKSYREYERQREEVLQDQ